ncbi:unnamed protein product [Owenia fusiformis]|uniref:Uncharacterized protein n=1 Tax=Owenia fusiformis TaxID=6347 RepID=A0A8S4Q3R7_OWEFU|nr:unnamed protein product [Owenia fusiformis]
MRAQKFCGERRKATGRRNDRPQGRRRKFDWGDYTHNFNRGYLFNVGYREALKLTDNTTDGLCVIRHDIDLLLEDDRLIYECSRDPTHFSVGVDTLQYRLSYDLLFGGVVAILGEQFNEVNGFSNIYFGWGGEDDDFRARLFEFGFIPVHHKNVSWARYSMLTHKHADETQNNVRHDLLRNGYQRYNCDGLSSTMYTVTNTEFKKHNIFIRINTPVDLKMSTICMNCFYKDPSIDICNKVQPKYEENKANVKQNIMFFPFGLMCIAQIAHCTN